MEHGTVKILNNFDVLPLCLIFLNIDNLSDCLPNVKLLDIFSHLFVTDGLEVEQVSDEEFEELATAVLNKSLFRQLLDRFRELFNRLILILSLVYVCIYHNLLQLIPNFI